MTTIPPPAPPPPIPPATLPRALPTLTVANPPADLATLPPGTRFEGTVVAEGTTIAVRIETARGTLQIQTTLPLAEGARLNLVLQNLTAPPHFQITAVNGRVPPATLRAAPPEVLTNAGHGVPKSGAPSAQFAASIAPPAVPRGLIGASLTAVMLRPSVLQAGSVGPAAGPPSPIASTLDPAPSTGSATGLATRVPATTPGWGHAPANAASPAGGSLPGPPPLVPGTLMAVRVVAFHPPGAEGTPPLTLPPTTPALPAVGLTMTALVTGHTPTGQAILHTPVGFLTTPTDTPLPRGATIVLEIETPPSPPTPNRAEPVSPLPAPALFMTRAWPALSDAYQALQASHPDVAQDLISTVLPQANARMTADVLFFLAALRGGNLGDWLTPGATRLLRRERPELLTRLGEEFRSISTLAREPVAADWRIVLVPFFNGSEIDQLRLFLRPYGGDDEEDTAPKGLRFILDVELSRLGRLQLDGLMRDDRKRFDLIVRSERPLASAMQNDIRSIFEEANATTGVSGGLSFQSA
ncbi:MAG: hypothetical protein RBS99_08525, partial [Rhodospirillales bacterium]|nr:hypothetical protein [Rhodospirillales bacterium]